MKKYSLLGGLLLSAILTIGTTTYAKEEQITVADVDMVLYATSEAEILATPDNNNVIIPKSGVEDGLGIIVTGITSNGFFRVNLGDGNAYYVAGNGLTDWPWNETNPYPIPEDEPVITPDTNTNYTLPYIVNGIDIRSGDVNGDGISDNHQNTWYDGVTWTASNGVTLRVADGFELNPGHMNVYSVFYDGTEDIRPNSAFSDAFDEFTGRAYSAQISPADIPKVVPVSTKQTVINPSYPSFVAYKQAFDPLWQKQNASSMACLQPYNKNSDGTANGIGLLDMHATSNYMWTMDYDAGSGIWILTLKSNYTELIWNSIHNSICLITPDANQVYTEIYNACYSSDSLIFQNKNNWVTIGNTNVMWAAVGNSGKVTLLIQ